MKEPRKAHHRQQAKLAWVATVDPRLRRAALLEDGLRLIFRLPYDEAQEALDVWTGVGAAMPDPGLVDLQQRNVKDRASILPAIKHGLSNGRIDLVAACAGLPNRSTKMGVSATLRDLAAGHHSLTCHSAHFS